MSDIELKTQLIPNTEDEKEMTKYEIFKTCLYLGVTSFGGPIAHIGMFEKEFIKNKKVISSFTFSQLFALANVIPGPTSSQLLTAIAIVKTKSLLGGVISFLCFNMPALILMMTITNIIKNKTISSNLSTTMSTFINTIGTGVCQGAVAIVLQAAISLTSKVKSSNSQLFITFTSAIIYLNFNKYLTMIVLMVISGSISMSLQEEKFLLQKPQKIFELSKVKFIGLPALTFFVIIYFLLYSLNYFFYNFSINFYLMESFYRIGSLIIGGGHVVLPMVLNEFEKLLTRKDILDAFTIVSILPGPMFNIAGYIGTLLNGVFSGFVSAFFIFLPGMLLLFTGLKFMSWINERPKLQFFLRGVSSSAIGFIFTSAILLWYDSCVLNKYYHHLIGTLNFLGCYVLLERYKLNVVLVLCLAAVYALGVSIFNLA